MAEHNDLGFKGEELAIDFLIKKGYKIVETNYRFKRAEIDIIAKKDDFLIVVEVKTRSNISYGKPEEFVSPKKIKLLMLAINNYIEEENLDNEIRFDIISVKKKNSQFEINHLVNAFYSF